MKPKLRIVKRWDWSSHLKTWVPWYCVEKLVAATWFSKEKWVEQYASLYLQYARDKCAALMKAYRLSQNPKSRAEEILWQSKQP